MAFQKGVSGNPGGRKKALITIELEKIANQVLPDGTTEAQALARVMWNAAKLGEPIAYKYVTDRIDGSPVQTVNANVNDTSRNVDTSKLTEEQKSVLADVALTAIEEDATDD